MKSVQKGLVVACVVLGFSACNSSGPAISRISGHYEGSLITHLNGAYAETSVRTDIAQAGSQSNGASPQYQMKDMSGAAQLTLQFGDVTDSSLSIQSSLVMSQPMTLNFDSQSGCYTAKADILVTLCATDPEISFDIDDASGNSMLSLVLYQFAPEQNLGDQEKPQTFTLTAAIDRARTMSFASKIEFEHVIQAKGLARAAYLHLLPQITLGTVANNLAPSFTTALQCIGDLAPFLLPSRWLQASEASDQSQAEQDAYRIMRLDTGAQIEGLFYTYDRDRQSLADYVATTVKYTAIRDDVKKHEALGQLPVGSTDNIDAALGELEHSTDVFRQVLAEDRSAISEALGFFNPMAVQDATIDNEVFPIDNAPSVDFQSVNNAAISRSFELDQMDWLISAAKLNKISDFFDWLDPAGDPDLGLGVALPSQIDVAQSQINELGIDRDETQSIISETAFNAVTDYNQALDNYADSTDDMGLHIRRLNEIVAQMDAGQKIEIAMLMDILDDYINEQLELEEARADYRVARSQIDRLLLQGYYAKF